MAFIPRSIHSDSSFTPLFRLLDDFNDYSRQSGGHHHDQRFMAWQPKFDIRETDANYELHGELPGMSKDDVHIQFTEPQTMLVRGKVVRSYSAGHPPIGQIEGGDVPGAITKGNETQEHKASTGGAGDEKDSQPATEPNVQRTAENVKYWLSERSIGEFSRRFSFPATVDQNSVTANFKDGILSILVPKAKNPEFQRINIT